MPLSTLVIRWINYLCHSAIERSDIHEHREVRGALSLCHFDAELSGARNPKPCSTTTTALIKHFITIWFYEMSRQRFWPLRSTARHDISLVNHSHFLSFGH